MINRLTLNIYILTSLFFLKNNYISLLSQEVPGHFMFRLKFSQLCGFLMNHWYGLENIWSLSTLEFKLHKQNSNCEKDCFCWTGLIYIFHVSPNINHFICLQFFESLIV